MTDLTVKYFSSGMTGAPQIANGEDMAFGAAGQHQPARRRPVDEAMARGMLLDPAQRPAAAPGATEHAAGSL